MRIIRTVATMAVTGAILVSCGRAPQVRTAPADPASPAAALPPVEQADAPTAAVVLEQPAVWPAPDVVFATPEEAAADFVSSVFGVQPTLGEFRAGDQRSGEIDVLYDGPEVSSPQFRSGLALRKLTPTDGWFVLFGRNDAMTITTPGASANVAREPLSVEGRARGFEGTLNVVALAMGVATPLDTVIAQGGAFETPEPFSATLDLSSVAQGTVAIVVRGDTGLDDDPGEFSVIPVVVTDTLPPTR